MKNRFGILISVMLFAVVYGDLPCAADNAVRLEPGVKNELVLSEKKTIKDKNLVLKDQNAIRELVKMQQEEEIKDIELLWNSTVDNNTLIKFTMTKLNAPETQRRLHSSIMAKSLSALIYGASFIPMFAGQDALIQSASYSAGRLANNYLNKEAATGQKPPVTDTELIQLAGTIEELQEKIISSYYDYKAALIKLKDTRARIILYNQNYSDALEKNSLTELVVSSALYENMQLQEYKQEQEAKKHYLALERMAGKKAVDSLTLSQYALKNELINTEVKNQ